MISVPLAPLKEKISRRQLPVFSSDSARRKWRDMERKVWRGELGSDSKSLGRGSLMNLTCYLERKLPIKREKFAVFIIAGIRDSVVLLFLMPGQSIPCTRAKTLGENYGAYPDVLLWGEPITLFTRDRLCLWKLPLCGC